MKIALMMLFATTLFGACSAVPPSHDKADWYVVLEYGGPEKLNPVSKNSGTVCLKIMAKSWIPLIGPDGLGGPREGYLYWTSLVGDGPIYPDPAFNDGLNESRYVGSIAIDKQNKKVVIDLQRIISKPGETQKTEPSPANGSYAIKRWIK